MKRLLAMLLTLVMLCTVLSISAIAEGTEEKVVYISINDGDPGTLDPFKGTGSGYLQSVMQIYDRILDMDDSGNLVGSLAKEWKREGDTLIFTLYDNIYDTAGNHFTAEDAVWCFGKFHENALTDAGNFTNEQVIDEYTFSVDISADAVTLLKPFTSLMFVTRAAYEASGENMATKVVSTGPYMVEEYVTGSTLTLVKNDNYWQKNPTVTNQRQNVDKIVYNYMTEAAQIAINLESHVVDFAFVDWTVADRFTTGQVSGNFAANEVQTWGGNDLCFNMSDKSYFKDNPDLRKAIFYAIDKEAIVEAVWNGHAQVPKAYGNYNYPDADPKWQEEDYFGYNPELAQEYFEKSGYKPGELTLKLIYPQSSYCDNMAEIIQAYLGIIGINVEVNGLENAIYNEYSGDPTQYDIMFVGGGGDGSITRIWSRRINKAAFTTDYVTGFINDDELQALVEAACNPATHSQETVNAVHYYLKDAAYIMRLYIEYKCCVTNADKIVQPFVNSDARPVPGAFTYSWSK